MENLAETLNEFVVDCIEEKRMSELKERLAKTREADIIDAFHNMSAENQIIVYRLLPKDKALNVFEQLETSAQEDLIISLTQAQAAEIIDWLDPDDRVRLLDELPAKVAKKMLSTLPPKERAKTNLLMGYEPETAGHIMTPDFVSLSRHMTVAEAIFKIKKQAPEKETVYSLYVTNETKVLEGVTSLRKLLLADPKAKIEDIMLDTFTKVDTDTDQEQVVKLLKKRDLLAIPVVDKENRIVGIISVDDAMDILEAEATEDILNKAGLAETRGEENRSELLIKGSIWSVLRIRLPFLVLTLAGGLLAGSVIGVFEDTLETIVAVALFIPVIMGMGGNVGIQSSTIFIRGLLLEHVNTKKIWRHIGREVLVGLSIGLIVGLICGFAAFLWQGVFGDTLTLYEGAQLGAAVGLALAVTMTLSAFIGFLVPYVLYKLNIDQAAGTDPVITTIKDISGLTIYFLFVSLFLSHMF